MKPDNAAALFSQPDVDGGLVGGASLVAADFLAIADCGGLTQTRQSSPRCLMTILNVVYVLHRDRDDRADPDAARRGCAGRFRLRRGRFGTVFGSRGAANFLSKSTKWLAIVFFAISLFMAWQSRTQCARPQPPRRRQDLGLMSDLPAAPAADDARRTGSAAPAAGAAPRRPPAAARRRPPVPRDAPAPRRRTAQQPRPTHRARKGG